ncbi:MAG: helix-turn-helix transcriptional regulator [Candidatus Hydrothermarchaeales archaeon]
MTNQDLREFRKKMDWTQTELGNALDVSIRTIIAWEMGDRPIPRVVELAAKYIEECYPPSKRKELIGDGPFFDDFFRQQKKHIKKS